MNESLKIHHVIVEIIQLITSLYSDYDVSILTDNLWNHQLKFKGVFLKRQSVTVILQPYSQYFNQHCQVRKSWMHGICIPRLFVTKILVSVCWWYRHNDSVRESFFIKWTTWADLIIRVDKCHMFGIKKTTRKSDHSSLSETKEYHLSTTVKSFTYLGKYINFLMICDEIKTELLNEIVKYVDIIDKLPIKCLHQIEIIQRYVILKLKWRFSVYNLSETWISENLDSHINRYYRKWLNIPVSGNITHLTLPKSKLVLNIKTSTNLCRM